MRIKVQTHGGPRKTAKEMRKSAKFFNDLGDLQYYTLEEFYEFVRKIPYIDDPKIFKRAELVSRPKYLLKAHKLDCKKKAILVAAWCNAQKPPLKYKFVATSNKDDKELHHVFPIISDNNGWLVADATYSSYFLGKGKPELTYFEVL